MFIISLLVSSWSLTSFPAFQLCCRSVCRFNETQVYWQSFVVCHVGATSPPETSLQWIAWLWHYAVIPHTVLRLHCWLYPVVNGLGYAFLEQKKKVKVSHVMCDILLKSRIFRTFLISFLWSCKTFKSRSMDQARKVGSASCLSGNLIVVGQFLLWIGSGHRPEIRLCVKNWATWRRWAFFPAGMLECACVYMYVHFGVCVSSTLGFERPNTSPRCLSERSQIGQ